MSVLNPAPAQTLPTGLLERVDVLVPNETEAALDAVRVRFAPLARASPPWPSSASSRTCWAGTPCRAIASWSGPAR